VRAACRSRAGSQALLGLERKSTGPRTPDGLERSREKVEARLLLGAGEAIAARGASAFAN
jgi:hypothetical protein